MPCLTDKCTFFLCCVFVAFKNLMQVWMMQTHLCKDGVCAYKRNPLSEQNASLSPRFPKGELWCALLAGVQKRRNCYKYTKGWAVVARELGPGSCICAACQAWMSERFSAALVKHLGYLVGMSCKIRAQFIPTKVFWLIVQEALQCPVCFVCSGGLILALAPCVPVLKCLSPKSRWYL